MGIPLHTTMDIHTPSTHPTPSTSSNTDTNGAPTTTPLQQLILQKDALESELKALGSVLDSHNVGMHTPLLTPDGFPRADIDVPQIRSTRARIVRLRNDLKGLMARIEEGLHEHFAAAKADGAASAPGGSTNTAGTANGDAAAANAAGTGSSANTPFARVNGVEEASPAAEAGLRPRDLVLAFGEADWLNHEKLARVARIVAASEGRGVDVRVARDGEEVRLRVVPRRGWGGRGLLGCHLVPL